MPRHKFIPSGSVSRQSPALRRATIPLLAALLAPGIGLTGFVRAEDQQPSEKDLLRDPTEAYLIRLQRHLATLTKDNPDPPPMVHECRLALPGLRAMAKSAPEADQRIVAINGLVWMYPVSELEAPVILAAMKDRDPGVRETAAMAASRMLPDADDFIPPLTMALGDASSSVRGAAAQSLGEFGPMSVTAVDELMKLAQGDKDDTARAAAIEAVSYLDPNRIAPMLAKCVKDDALPVKWAACMSLRRIVATQKERPATLSALRELVMDEKMEPSVRASAFTALWAQAPDGPDAAAALESAITLPPGENRTWLSGDRRFLYNFTARMKGSPGPEQAIILKALSEWPLKDEEVTSIIARRFAGDTLPAELQAGMIEILSERGKGDTALVEKVTEIVSVTANEREFVTGMRYLGRAGVSAADRAALILARTREARSEVGQVALEMVEELGDDAANHVELLTEAYDSMRTRVIAGKVMLKLNLCPEDMRDHLVDLLNEAPDSEELRESREITGRLIALTGPEGVRKLRETAVDAEKTRTPLVRAAAIRGLGDAGSAARQDVPLMIDLLMGDNVPMRLASRDALASLRENAVDTLLAELKSEEPKRAHRAFTVFYRMGPSARKWSDALIDAHVSGRMRGGGNEKMHSLFDTLSDVTLPKLMEIMETGDTSERRAAAFVVEPMAVETLAKNADRLMAITTKFGDLVPLRSRMAADVLPTLPDGRARLDAVLNDHSRQTREAAAAVMVEKGWVDDRVIDVLASVAEVQSIRCLAALQRLGPKAQRVLPRINAIARDPRKFGQNNYYAMAMAVVVSIDRGPDRVTLLHDFLKSPRPFDPGAAAAVIYMLPREQARQFIPEMRTALAEHLKTELPERAVVQMIARSLSIIDSDRTFLTSLADVLAKSENADRRFLGELISNELDARAHPGIGGLTERLLDTTIRGTTMMDHGLLMRELVYRADKRGLPVLRVLAARSKDADVRDAAIRAIDDLETILRTEKPITAPAKP